MAQTKYTDGSGVAEIWANIKNYVYSQLLGKADASHTHTKSQITDFPTLSTVATSGSYNDLSNKPTIPTVNNATLKIQKNGTNVKTFTANASTDVTCNITVPTKTSDLTNDSGFLTSHQSLSNYSTLANTVKSISISGKTITVTPGSGNAYTLTTQDTVYTHPTTAGNKHVPSGGSNGQFLGWSADGTAKWVNNPNTNTWTAMVGATSSSNGSVGYVNAVPPKDGYNTKYLRADGTWQVPPDHTYTVNNATLTIQKNGTTVKTFTANASSNVTCNITVPTKVSELNNDNRYTSCLNSTNSINFDWSSTYSNKVGIKVDNTWLGGILTTANTTIPSKTSQLTNDSGFLTSHQSLSGYVPRSGGAVMTAQVLGKTKNDDEFRLDGGTDWNNCASLCLRGKNKLTDAGSMLMNVSNGSTAKQMLLYPSGTWTWTGTAVQLISDQRYKQQITEIDDKLLDAWQDVNLVQFKYNDAVDQKGDNARLHTGYVVQQIDSVCKKHGVDVSQYGLYCHEEYPQETEEVEVEQKDGTKTKETKVIREASEHYSLRYTEVYAVECMYLRRCIARLTARIEELEKGNNTK